MSTQIDGSAFAEEIQSVEADEGSMIDVTEFTSFIEFLQRLAHSGVDVSYDPTLESAVGDLASAVNSIPTPNGGV